MKTKHEKVVNALYCAVKRYVEEGGGKIIVVGGIQVQEWPGDSEYAFTIGVKCTGKKPVFSDVPKGGSL